MFPFQFRPGCRLLGEGRPTEAESTALTQAFQPRGARINEVLEQGGELLKALQAFVDDASVQEPAKKRASTPSNK